MEDLSSCDMTPYGQVASSSETSLCLYLSTHCYIPADIHLCSYCHENLTLCKTFFVHHEQEAMLFTALLSWSEDDDDDDDVVVVVVVVFVFVFGGGGDDDDSEEEEEERWGSYFWEIEWNFIWTYRILLDSVTLQLSGFVCSCHLSCTLCWIM